MAPKKLFIALALLVFVVCVPIVSLAASVGWDDCYDTTHARGALSPTESVACSDPDENDTSTVLLDGTACSKVSFLFDDNQASATVSAVTATIYTCTKPTASTNHCKVLGGITLTGTPPNNEAYHPSGGWFYATTAGYASSETPRLLAVCER